MDWISSFVSATAGLPTPERFRLWSAILVISSVLERRVWSPSSHGELFPNCYAGLIGLSGSGKTTLVKIVRNLLARVKGVNLSPDNMSNASFYDALFESGKTIGLTNGGKPLYYSAMAIPCREIGVLFPRYEMGFLSDLSDIYDNPPLYNSKRRQSKSVNIEGPTVNLLIGATPGYLGDLLPETAWSQGFCARLVLIHGIKPIIKGYDLLSPAPIIAQISSLAKELESMTHLSGSFTWSPVASSALHLWFNDGQMSDAPNHSRLQEYNTRRDILVMKLSMISAVSEGHAMTIERSDFERALEWILDAERAMPEVFAALSRGGDAQTLRDLSHHVSATYLRHPIGSRKPLSTSDLWHFLHDKTDSWKINSLIEAAEKSGLISRGTFPDEWLPCGIVPPTSQPERTSPPGETP